MRPTDYLRSLSHSEWDNITEHDFCRQLAKGSLPVANMQWYLAQDYKFIDGFVRLLATAIAHAPTIDDAVPAAKFLALVTGPENDYFQRSFDALSMSKEQQDPKSAPQTVALQNVMHTARISGRYELMLAVLVVAQWSYLSWAQRYVDYDDDLPLWFSQWIDLHCGEYFESVVGYLRTQLDQVWITLSTSEKEAVSKMFKLAVNCELNFFDAAFTIKNL